MNPAENTFREVYVFDMNKIEKLFSQNLQKSGSKNLSFGIPFLLNQKGSEMLSFASLVLDKNNQVSYEVYDNGNLTPQEKAEFENYIALFLKKKNNGNFNDAEQFKKSSNYLAKWLNL